MGRLVTIPNPDKSFSILWCLFWLIVFWPMIGIQIALYVLTPSTINVVCDDETISVNTDADCWHSKRG